MSGTPDYIRAFVTAVYPDAPDLALVSFNERKCLEDATEEITRLRAELATVTSEKMNAITELVTYEARLKETQHVYAKTCGRLETERDDLKIALITANERLAAEQTYANRWRELRKMFYHEQIFENQKAIDAACKGE